MVIVINTPSPLPLPYLLNPSSTFSKAEYLRFLTSTLLGAVTPDWSELVWGRADTCFTDLCDILYNLWIGMILMSVDGLIARITGSFL